MKKLLLYYKPLFLGICILLFVKNTEAQTVLWGNINVETPVVKCGDNGQMNVNFTIGGGLSNGSIEVGLPAGVSYAGNITFIRTGSGTVTHNATSPSNRPAFILGSVANGEIISISFDRNFNCSASTSVADTIYAYENSVQVGTRRISPLYNIQGASLSVSGISNTPSIANVGTNVTRIVSITNQNFGYVRNFTYLDKFPANSYSVNTSSFIIHSGSSTFAIPSAYIKIATTNDSITINFDTILIKNIGNFNNKFERNESFELSYVVSPLNCGINGNILSDLSVWWGCNGSVCQIGTASFNMDINYSGSPNLVLTTIAPAKICLGLIPNAYTTRIINNGNGSATSISLEMYAYYNNSSRGAYYIDTNVVRYKIGVNGSYVHPAFTDVQVRSGTYYSSPYNCSIAGQPHRFTMNIPTLAAGDTIFLNYNVHCCNSSLCSPASNNASLSMNGVLYNIYYKNQCGLNNYSQLGGTMIPNMSPSINTTTQFPTDINDTQTKEFTVLVSNESFAYSTYSFVQSTSAYYEATITLPAGITFDNSLGDGVKWFNATRTAFWSGVTISGTNPVIVRFPIFGKTINTTNSELVYKLKGVCGTSGEKTINISFRFIPDPANVCGVTSDIQLMCFSKTVNLHCLNPFAAGVNFFSYTQERKNYGMIDNDNNGMPDASGTMDMNKVKKDRLMFGDTLQTIFNGAIKTDVANPLFQYVFAKLAINSVNSNFNYTIPANVKIKRAAGPVINGTVVATRNGDSLFYNISSLGGNVFNDGDSVEIISNLVVKTNIGGAYNSYISRGDFYAAHVANPTGANRFQSDYWGSTVSIIGYYFTIYQQNGNPLSFTNGCENKQLYIGYYLSIGPCCSNYNGGNLFPYEVRRWSFLDSVQITMPLGYTIVSSTFNNYRTGGTNVSVTEIGGTINPSNITGNTYTYKFHDLYNQFGGSLMNISDDGWLLTQVYTIQPSGLIRPMYVEKNVPITAYFGSANQIPATTMSSPSSSKLVYSGAIPDLIANTPIVDAYTKNIKWRASLQNLSPAIIAPNSWIYIKKRNNDITITEVKYDNIVILPNANGFYQLNTLNGGVLKSIIIKAITNSCSNDSIKVYTGYSCDGAYPISINNSRTAKLDSISLIVKPKLAQITANLTSLTNTPTNPSDPNSPVYGSDYVNMCDSFPVQLQIISAQPATIYDIRELIQLPVNMSGNAGIQFVSGSAYIEYPLGTTPRPFSSAANAALSVPGLTNLTMDLAQIDPANFGSPTSGLMGSMHPDSNKVIIRFKFSTNCNLPSRSVFKITSKAKSPCGANAIGDNALISSSILPITGVVNSNAANIDISIFPSTTFTSCDPTQNGLLIIEKIGPNPVSITDSIYITMPSIFNINGPIACNGTNCPGPNPIVYNDIVGTQRIIRWQYPQNFNSLPNNGSGLGVSYSFVVELLDVNNTTPLTMNMSAQVVEQSIVMCGLNTCPNSTTIIGESDVNVQIGGSVIGISKDITEVQYINNFSYDVTYRMIVKNYSNIPLSNVQVFDTLINTFPSPSAFSVISKTTTGNLEIEPNYNGSTVYGLLNSGNSNIDAGESDTILLKINISTNSIYGPFYNQSFAQANNTYNCMSYDLSDNGSNPDPDGDNNPNEIGENDPTPLQFNAPPVTFNEYNAIDEDNILNGLSILSNGDFDPDGTTLSINDTIPIVNTQHGTILLWSNGTFTYTPFLNYNGNDFAVFNICDTGIPAPGLCTGDSIFIVVNPVNDPPITVNEFETTNENSPIIKTQSNGILSNGDYDPDLTSLSLNIIPVKDPLHGTIILSTDGAYTYTPNQYYNGYDTVIVSVCDNGTPMPSLCTNDTLFFTIDGANNPPVTFNETEITNEDIPIIKTNTNGILSNGDYDPESTSLTVNTTPVVEPVHGNIVLNTDGSYTYTPFVNYYGNDMVVFSVCDNGIPLPAACTNDTLFIQILPVNDPPVTYNEIFYTLTNTPIVKDSANGILSNGDYDPDLTNIVIDTHTVIGPLHGTVTVNSNGSFVYTPNNNYTGDDIVIVDVCDNGFPLPALCTKDTITIQITMSENHPPVALNNYMTVPINTQGTVDPNSNNTDPDNNIDITATTIISIPNNGIATLNATSGIITYVPDFNYTGSDTIVVSICDTGMPIYCVNDTIFVQVEPAINHPPVTVNNFVVIPINTNINIDPNTNNYDPDNNIDTTATTILINPKNGVALLNASNGIINYTPNNNYIGYDTIVVSICDTGMPVYCVNDTVFIQITNTFNTVIGLAKKDLKTSQNMNGSYDITYYLTLQDLGDEDLINVQVYDSLIKAFPLPAVITMIGSPISSGNIVVNTNYNGLSDCKLLIKDNSTLAVGTTSNITFSINVLLKDTAGIFYNSAYTTANGISGINTFDISDNGFVTDENGNKNPNEQGENDPTPLELNSSLIFIPQGFSPNGDGVDDVFVIYGNGESKVSITIHNRWGNVVFEEDDYKNDWGGKANKGLTSNADLPEGTYFYIINLHNGQKNKLGSFIIKR